MWTLQEAVEVARDVERAICKHGAHVALGGGVLIHGESGKDLDLFLYPHCTGQMPSIEALQAALESSGLNCVAIRDHSQYNDEKIVWHYEHKGRRIDFFFLMLEYEK